MRTNEGLDILAKFIGYPLPVLFWSFKKNLTDDYKTLSGEFQSSSVSLNVSTIRTVLTKETLIPEEFGYYSATATNPRKPSQISIVTYHVISERRPDPSYNISINCMVSHGTAVVNWVPGFDGGAEQTFFVSYRTNNEDEKITIETYKQPNATITGLNDDTLYYFRVISSNSNGKTLSEEEESCKTQVFIKSTKELNLGGIIGGTLGGVVLIILILLIFLSRKYPIRCLGRGADMSAQYEELNQNRREQESSYDSIRTPNSKGNSNTMTKDSTDNFEI
ncbi:uncharacterized protein LOC133196094 [Saccostrea echinata]|uniref:uncharacterized protein LOC133196094 n=1 Tax=Saccostrea echinata TaxID=191078 RepID=UPI002A82D5EC|nr:uncharacterized protein LOC133196094 [Saccostrea echinata]